MKKMTCNDPYRKQKLYTASKAVQYLNTLVSSKHTDSAYQWCLYLPDRSNDYRDDDK
ncbi:hypothetical protein [Vibrio salilacus]|uniref:hypothetical protein n=1 Tax=Vibrio salilacus TaxID=1323749 RepID=UPI0012FD9C49|nr:hypothetical protein [Vibrio salilacus]